jgi:hypothetical protein
VRRRGSTVAAPGAAVAGKRAGRRSTGVLKRLLSPATWPPEEAPPQASPRP